MNALMSPCPDEEAAIRARIVGKSCALVEAELPQLFVGLRDPEASTGTKIAIFRLLMDLGNLTPKKDVQVANQGAQFSISIVLPGPDGKNVTIEGKVNPADEIEGTPPEALMIDFSGNGDLVGDEDV